MTLQTEILIKKNADGFAVIGAHQHKTLLPKRHINKLHEIKIREAIRYRDSVSLYEVLSELRKLAHDGGWDKAPALYLLKHNGFMFTKGKLNKRGVMSDLTFTLRTPETVLVSY